MTVHNYWHTQHTLLFTWEQVAAGYWNRYPNLHSSHVFSEDFVEVAVGGGHLRTKRIIMKTNNLPWWGQNLFSARRVPLIEECVVNPARRTMVTYTRNIALRRFMGVTEKVTFHCGHTSQDVTLVDKEVWIESDIVGMRRAIRKFGIDRFKKNCVLATQGFAHILGRKYPREAEPVTVASPVQAL